MDSSFQLVHHGCSYYLRTCTVFFDTTLITCIILGMDDAFMLSYRIVEMSLVYYSRWILAAAVIIFEFCAVYYCGPRPFLYFCCHLYDHYKLIFFPKEEKKEWREYSWNESHVPLPLFWFLFCCFCDEKHYFHK